MKKKFILFSSVILLMVFAVAPLMASSAKACLIVPASVVPNGAFIVSDYSQTTLPSGLIVGSANLAVANLLTIGAKSYDTDSISAWTWVINPVKEWTQSRFDGSWQVIGSPMNGFRYNSWSFVITEYGYDVSTMAYTFGTVQVVAQGFGCFAGETLVLHYAGTAVETGTWTGYVIRA